MATYTTRKNATRAQVRMQGQEASATFDTRMEAEQWAERIEQRIKCGETIDQDAYGENPTVSSLMKRYAEEVSPSKVSHLWEKSQFTRFAALPIFQKRILNFAPSDVAAFRDSRKKTVGNGTVIRELGLLSTLFTQCIQEWSVPMKVNPVSMVRRPAQPQGRTRRVKPEEVVALRAELDWPHDVTPVTSKQWCAWAFLFALETAMRRTEMLTIKWKHVYAKRVHLPHTKNGLTRDVPLSPRARALLMLVPNGKPEDFVADIRPANYSLLFRKACTKLELENIRGHDGRHEATTQLAKVFTNVLELGAVTGHKDLRMLKRYFNATADELADKFAPVPQAAEQHAA
jgi:integrase